MFGEVKLLFETAAGIEFRFRINRFLGVLA